jgi:hypothetical protein
MLVDGDAINSAYIPSGFRARKAIIYFGSDTSQAQNLTHFYMPGGHTTTETQVSNPMTWKCVARKLRVEIDSAPVAGQTVTATLRKAETTDTAVTAQIDNAAGRTQVDATHEVEFAAGDLWSVKVVTSATSGTKFVRGSFEVEEIP